MVTAPLSASAWAIARVPAAKFSNSNTPMGPFHTTVPAPRTASQKVLVVSGPMSMPSQPSGMAMVLTTCRRASLEKPSAATVSVGSSSFTPFFLAFSIISRA